MSLELIGRATLAKIHPALIADPREGSNIMHAFGYGSTKELPKTIGAKTIFLRLQVIVPEFTPQDEKFCLSFINMRNEELHTGTPIFNDYPTNTWLTKFYSAIKVLLNFQGKQLIDFLGKNEAKVADQMISEYKEELINKVNEEIKKFRDAFKIYDEELKRSKSEAASKLMQEFKIKEKIYGRSKDAVCPACSQKAMLIGTFISQSEPRIYMDRRIDVNSNFLPVELRCFCCDLIIHGNGELTVAELGGQFVLTESSSPEEYYEIETDPITALKNQGFTLRDLEREFGFDDYGND